MVYPDSLQVSHSSYLGSSTVRKYLSRVDTVRQGSNMDRGRSRNTMSIFHKTKQRKNGRKYVILVSFNGLHSEFTFFFFSPIGWFRIDSNRRKIHDTIITTTKRPLPWRTGERRNNIFCFLLLSPSWLKFTIVLLLIFGSIKTYVANYNFYVIILLTFNL